MEVVPSLTEVANVEARMFLLEAIEVGRDDEDLFL